MASKTSNEFYEEISKLINIPPDCKSFTIKCDQGSLVMVTSEHCASSGTGEPVTRTYDLVEREGERSSPVDTPHKYELVDALVGMACQYLQAVNPAGQLQDDMVSAGEICIDNLERLGLVKDRKLINEAFDIDYLEAEIGA